MKSNILHLILAVFIAITFSACAMDNYEMVPAKTERVLVKRPHAYFKRNAGVEIPLEPLTMGQRNHGNGPCLAYDFDVTIQNQDVPMNVKTADSINVPFVVGCAWRIIPGRSVDLALNFMPEFQDEEGNPFRPSGSNSVKVVNVSNDAIFHRNILPFLDEVGRDIIDSQRSKDIRREELAQQILQAVVQRLQQHKIPKAQLTEKGIEYGKLTYVDGKPSYDGSLISIADVIEIQRISVRYENPEVINKEINKIEMLKADVLQKRAELAQWVQKTETRIKQARNARQTAINIKTALDQNPMMKKYQRLDNLRQVLDSAKPGINTKVYLMPREMVERAQYTFGKNPTTASARPSSNQ